MGIALFATTRIAGALPAWPQASDGFRRHVALAVAVGTAKRKAATQAIQYRAARIAQQLLAGLARPGRHGDQPLARSVRAPSMAKPLRILRVVEPQQPASVAGRMVISGRMADVCAELDRLVAAEAARPSRPH